MITTATMAATAATASQPALPKRPTHASVVATPGGALVFRRAQMKLAAAIVLVVVVVIGGAPSAASAAEPVIYTGATGRLAVTQWRYAADPGNVGLARGWMRGRFGGKLVQVPYVPNAWPLTGATGRRNFNGSVGWYRTTLRVPSTGAYALRFESVNHHASVWIDGRLVGQHTGVYMPFDVQPTLTAGPHVVVVRADWRDPVPGMKRAGWHRGWFNYGGINREVTLRKLEASEVEAPVVQTKLGSGGVAHVELSLRIWNRAATRTLAPAATLTYGQTSILATFPAQRVKAGTRAVFSTVVDVADPVLWSPSSPSLYDLRMGVPGPREGGWQGRIGLRQLTLRSHHPYLNGKPLFLYGAAIHEDARGHGDGLTAADMDRIVARLKAIGANATRAQHPLNPALLERLDAAGIMVWQEVGPWDSPGNWLEKTRGMQLQGLARIQQSFEQLQTHPSIFAWNLGNEVAANGHPGQGWFVDTAAKWLKARSTAQLTALDVWGIMLPTHSSRMYWHIDAIGTTSYFGWYEDTFASPARIRQLIAQRIAYMHKVFPGKIVLASEFGAEGNRLNKPMAHGGEAYQAALLSQTINDYVNLPDSSGALLWNLQDFGVNPEFGGGSILTKVKGIRLVRGLNQKGIYDLMGRPKPAVKAVAAAFKRARASRG